MHSNFITPPDFVDEKLHTVTVVDATDDDLQLLVRMCQHSDEMYNIYLYKSEMNDIEWLNRSVEISDAVIVNLDLTKNQWVCNSEKSFYYGEIPFISPAKRVENILHYFVNRNN